LVSNEIDQFKLPTFNMTDINKPFDQFGMDVNIETYRSTLKYRDKLFVNKAQCEEIAAEAYDKVYEQCRKERPFVYESRESMTVVDSNGKIIDG